MSSVSTQCQEQNEPSFSHLEIYHKIWQKEFNKPSDSLVLFYHYVLIHNRFKNVSEGQKTDFLPKNWNTAKQYYDLLYTKHGFNYRLEIYLIGNFLQICLKRLSDSVDILLDIKIEDYVDLTDYKHRSCTQAYHQLGHFYKRIQWSIDQVKHKKIKQASSSSSASSASSLNSVNKAAPNGMFGYKEIVAQIKQEALENNAIKCVTKSSITTKETLATNKVCRSNSTASTLSESTVSTTTLHTKVSVPTQITDDTPATTAKPSKRNTLSRADSWYVYNPITKYLNYNANVDRARTFDEDNQNNDPWVREMFETRGLRVCQISVVDVMKSDFVNMQVPIHVNKAMKMKYELSTESSGVEVRQPVKEKKMATNNNTSNNKKAVRKAARRLPTKREKKVKKTVVVEAPVVMDKVDSSTCNSPSIICVPATESLTSAIRSPRIVSSGGSPSIVSSRSSLNSNSEMDRPLILDNDDDSSNSTVLPDLCMNSIANVRPMGGVVEKAAANFASIFTNLKKKTNLTPVRSPAKVNGENKENSNSGDSDIEFEKPDPKRQKLSISLVQSTKPKVVKMVNTPELNRSQQRISNLTPGSGYKRPARNILASPSIRTPKTTPKQKDLTPGSSGKKTIRSLLEDMNKPKTTTTIRSLLKDMPEDQGSPSTSLDLTPTKRPHTSLKRKSPRKTIC